MPQNVFEDLRITFMNGFFPFSMWVLGIQQRLIGFDGKRIYP